MVNNILWSMEANNIVIVVAMDPSAAFDMVDHDILLQLVENRYGISGNIIKWFDSYLRPRSFKVNINDKYSSERPLDFSVPVIAETNCISELEECISSVNKWMGTMRLKMNPSKTELIYFGSKGQLDKCSSDCMDVGSSIVNTSASRMFPGKKSFFPETHQ